MSGWSGRRTRQIEAETDLSRKGCACRVVKTWDQMEDWEQRLCLEAFGRKVTEYDIKDCPEHDRKHR